MPLNSLQKLLLDSVRNVPATQKLQDFLKAGSNTRVPGIRGLRASGLPAVVAALVTDPAATPPPITLIITGNHERSGECFDDLQFFGLERTFHYPKSQSLPYDEDEPLIEEQVKHLELLDHLRRLQSKTAVHGAVAVTSIEALFTRVPSLDVLTSYTMRVVWGEPLDPQKFSQDASRLGYTRVPTVEARGEFSIRGGIIDIFPPDFENPVRIDLFGEDIESIRYFDVHTQRSLGKEDQPESLEILPAGEKVALGVDGQRLPILTDLLPPGSLVVLDHPEIFPVMGERFQQLVDRQYREHGVKTPGSRAPDLIFATLDEVQTSVLVHMQIQHSLVVEGGERAGISFETTSFETQKPSLENFLTQIKKRVADGYTVVIACDNDGQAQRMDEMLRENIMGAMIYTDRQADHPLPRNQDQTRDVILAVGLLHSGFVMADASIYLITDREIFGRYKRRHVYRKIYKGAPIADAREIRKGDFVVHLEHGIGRFEGIRTQNIDGRFNDFLELVYADDDKLLVPVEKIIYVQKFSGPEQGTPVLDRLGGKKWQQRKSKSQDDIEKMAHELLALHARRATAQGYGYGGDTHFQREFESSFLYTETPDQMRAINDVKRDMAGDKPMDRLVCGDVGYGKTEVAIRAAFKAIMDKKQAALLCPTTILARQHYDNFRERYADYPIRVEMLSRFRTPKETREALKGLADGSVHMVVGTHQLLSKNVQFQDLGLVIVDEEQRFGVGHKERLKEMRASVDFLTLTATPIPRTLYMALSGLRDMSVINTPPADRHPIKTKIIHWDRDLIEEAILRELNRSGQVFFVHNRVQNIHDIAEKIREIVPTARIAVAHGQMNEHDLEQIVLDFIDGKYDILVSTTIIESGVDIPNVNTIIINRADAFGLAQLYQLRGRVGRENRRAYAYLIIPAGQAITEQAVSRLQAIEEFTELGVGFNIAMRDMEIRGTGNLLGKEQHGTMNSIGFELYCRMLEEAVETLRGDIVEAVRREVEIQWKASAYMPPQYVPVESQRVMLYKRIAEAKLLTDLDELAAEVKDRYGEVTDETSRKTHKEDLPLPVENLFAIARMQLLGQALELRKISLTKTGFKLIKENILKDLGPKAQKLIKKGDPQIYADDPNLLEFSYANWSEKRQLRIAANVLAHMVE